MEWIDRLPLLCLYLYCSNWGTSARWDGVDVALPLHSIGLLSAPHISITPDWIIAAAEA